MSRNNWFLIGCTVLSIGLLSYGRHVTEITPEEQSDTTGGLTEASTSGNDSLSSSTGDTFSTEATSPGEGQNPLIKGKEERTEERDSLRTTSSTSDTFNTGNTGSTSSTKEIK